jgi:hypothetical protein
MNEARIPKSRTGDKLPTKLARVQREDVEAEKEEDEVAAETETDEQPKKIADRRNLIRVDKADEVDRNLLSKCYLQPG